MAPQKQNPADRNKLGTFGLVTFGIGSIIGSGIFQTFHTHLLILSNLRLPKKQVIAPIRIV